MYKMDSISSSGDGDHLQLKVAKRHLFVKSELGALTLLSLSRLGFVRVEKFNLNLFFVVTVNLLFSQPSLFL